MTNALKLNIVTEVEAHCIIASLWFARDNANEDFVKKYGTVASKKISTLTAD